LPFHPSIRTEFRVRDGATRSILQASSSMSARDVIANLRELAALTSTADGAQRLAWGPVWREARQWFNGKLASIGLEPVLDAAGNSWATLRGDSARTIIIG